jgi:hypothetical protein
VEWTDNFQKYDNDNFFLFEKFEDPLFYLKTPLSNISIELIKEKKVIIIIFLELSDHSTGHKNSYVHLSGQKCPIPPNITATFVRQRIDVPVCQFTPIPSIQLMYKSVITLTHLRPLGMTKCDQKWGPVKNMKTRSQLSVNHIYGILEICMPFLHITPSRYGY